MIAEQLGKGGLGLVYAALDPELDRRVAIKLLRADAAVLHGAGLRQRLLREAQAMARLTHPNVHPVYDFGVRRSHVPRHGARRRRHPAPLAERRATIERRDRWRVRGRGRGSAAAHAAGLMHRDFKPDNVLVGRDGRVFVTDFGLARPIESDEAAGDSGVVVSSTVTRAGVIVGTPAYMAPEQMRGEPADARADQFSFCVALFEALYGMRPFAGRTLEELQRAVSDGKRVTHERRGVPVRVRRAIDRGLSAEPAGRFASMGPLLQLLQSRRRAQLGVTIGLVGLIAAVGLIGWQRTQAVNRAQLCKDAAGKMSRLWNAEQQSAVQRALEKASVSSAWPLFKSTFDGYAARWVRMHDDACEMTHTRGEQSEALLDLRMDCLDQRYRDARALIEVVSAQDKAAEKALSALGSLPAIGSCADVVSLQRAPRSAVSASKLEPLRAQLAIGRAEIFTGGCEKGLADATAVAQQAHALGALGEEAQARFRMGAAHACLGNYQQAQNSYLEGAVAASSVHDDTRVAYSYIGLMQNSTEQQKFDDAVHWSVLGREAVERAGNGAELRADYLLADCFVIYSRDRIDEAEPECREALALYRKSGTGSKLLMAGGTLTLGHMMGDRGRFAEAAELYREAQRLFIEAQGPDSYDAIRVIESIAVDELEQDHLETALALEKRVLDSERTFVRLDDSVDSQALYGMMLVEAGRPDESLPIFLRALGMQEKSENTGGMLPGALRRGIGAAYLALDKPSQALPYLQEAWRILPTEDVEYERAMLGIDLAHALWLVTPDHAHALEVARGARDYLRAHPVGAFRKRKLAALESWIQARDKSR